MTDSSRNFPPPRSNWSIPSCFSFFLLLSIMMTILKLIFFRDLSIDLMAVLIRVFYFHKAWLTTHFSLYIHVPFQLILSELIIYIDLISTTKNES